MEENKVKILIFSGIGIFIILIIWAFMTVGGNPSDDMNTVTLNNQTDSEFTLDDMMKNQDNKVFNGSSVDPFAKETESIDNLIADQSKDTSTGFYDNENDALIAELQKEYDSKQVVQQDNGKSTTTTRYKEKIVYRDKPVNEKQKSNEIELEDFSFSISEDNSTSGTLRNDVPAVIDESYKGAKQNQVIRIRTTKDCIISGAFVPANTIIEGITKFGDRRVYIDIDGIDLGSSFVQCSLEVRDRLKRKGLETKSNLSQELKKQGSEEVAEGGNAKITTPLGSFGLNALKKKNNEPSVDLYENHKLYLRIKNR